MEEKKFDRRNDVGNKLFIGILTAVLTTVFLGSLGLGIRAYELGNKHEVRISVMENFIYRQDRLNEKWEAWLDSRINWKNHPK